MGEDDCGDLRDLRDEIDEIDKEISDLIVERTELAEKVAAVKIDEGMSLVDGDREDTVESQYAESFAENDLEPERGETLAKFLIETSLEKERRVDENS